MDVGVVLPLAEYPRKQPSYVEIRELALQAETAGFDSVWVFDHLLFRAPGEPTEGIWESWTVLSALAEATTRVRLGTLVLCTAFRNPAVLAKMAATLDEICGGRLILGLGAGWHQPEFEAFGIPFDHRISRFEEALQVIVSMLRDGELDFEGRYIRLRGTQLRPRAVRPPPVLVGGFRPRMLRLAARYGDMWNTCWFGAPSSLGEALAGIRAACADEGRSPESLEITVGVNVVPVADGVPTELPNYPVLAGTPAELANGLRGYTDLGVKHLICNLNPHHAEVQQLLADAVRLYRADFGPGSIVPQRERKS
ncbi:MAG: LLM class flavin-dependent oxidoreductase [Pseudonocardiaceae bacterium]